MPARREGPLTYWRRVARFALRGDAPATPEEVPTWALALPYRLWREVVRHDGRTFEDLQASNASPLARKVLPLRAMYLAFLFVWPLVAFVRALSRGRRALDWWRMALGYPELAVFHPRSDYTEREFAWSRPDFSLGMFHAWRYHRARDAYFALDDKRRFLEVCANEGLPTPPTLTAKEAMAKGGVYIVKDPQRDLGFGVTLLTAGEIRAFGPEIDGLIIQERLRNHPDLLRALPTDAPLSSFRVITTLDPTTREPLITRCAVRIGHAGAAADNTAQGGIWAAVDRDDGTLRAGVTKKSFGTWKNGAPVRVGAHPDTGLTFAGMRVPWFDEGRRMALDAHRRLAPDAVSLGWDVALAEGGPVLLEVNVWTTCYDYDPPDDAFTPACALVVAGLSDARA